MPDAVRLHLEGRTGRHAGLLGLFLCPASRLPELITELIKVKPVKPVALSLVIDTGLGGVPKALSIVESRVELLALRMVEMPAPSDVDEVWLERVSEFVPEDVVRVIEPRRGGLAWLDGIQRVVEHGSWPKLRCGGLSAQNFPSIEEVTDFLSVINEGGASFKATAGLHHAVRTGGEHGFLNLLAAACLGFEEAVLADEDPAAFRLTPERFSWRGQGCDGEKVAEVRRGLFTSFGSCSVQEPVDELEKLGIL